MPPAKPPILVVEDDPFLRLVGIVLDPTTSAERYAAYADFFAHDDPDFNGYCARVRARVPGQINFYTASVQNPQFDDEGYRESLAETLHRGFGGVKLDVVVAASYPVLQFAMQYRDHRCF